MPRMASQLKRLLFGQRRAQEDTQKPRLRSCRFEQLERRDMLAGDHPLPQIHIGATYAESNPEDDQVGDRFEVTYTGGVPGTRLTRIIISGDQDGNGFDDGDVFFDPISGAPGVGQAAPFAVLGASDIAAGRVTVSMTNDLNNYVPGQVVDGALYLVIDVEDWQAEEKLVFTIDVDEQDDSPNSLVEGAEFENSKLIADFTDINGNYQDVSGTGSFKDKFDSQIHASLDPFLVLDKELPAGENADDLTAGTGFTVAPEPYPVTISGTVFYDKNLNNQQGGAEVGISGVELALWAWDDATSQYVDTGLRDTTDGQGDYSFIYDCPGKFRVVESQPGAYPYSVGASSDDGTVGSNPNVISEIELEGGEHSANNDFAEAKPVSLSGYVYHDRDDDGVYDSASGEEGINGVTITVTVESLKISGYSGPTTFTINTAENAGNGLDGYYSFNVLPPGTYKIVETQPAGSWVDGKDSRGTIDGSAVGVVSNDQIGGVAFTASEQQGVQYNFGELKRGSISGSVKADTNGDCDDGIGETPLSGVIIELLDANGDPTGITTTTDAQGNFKFNNLAPGTYGVREYQPQGYFDGDEHAGTAGGTVVDGPAAIDEIINIDIGSDEHATDYVFCELPPGSISGSVRSEKGEDCFDGVDEKPIAGVIIELLDANGSPTGITTTTDAQGRYKFENLAPGTYGVREYQPSGYYDGEERAGSAGGIVVDGGQSTDDIVSINLGAGEDATDYDFCEHPPASISGRVVSDKNDECFDGVGEKPIAGVLIELLDANGNPTGITTTTDSQGRYEFTNLAPGRYGVREHQPTGYFDGEERAGSAGGIVVDAGQAYDDITTIDLGPGVEAVNYDFCEHPPSSISGHVFSDKNENCFDGIGEKPIAGVVIELLDANGNPTGVTTTTDANGRFEFTNLAPGTYGVREHEPTGYFDGDEHVGTAGGVAVEAGKDYDDIISINLGAGEDATDYDFCEHFGAKISGFVFQDGPLVELPFGDSLTPDEVPAVRNGQNFYAPIAGVKILLADENGNVLRDAHGNVISTTTNAAGFYQFKNLTPGTYTVIQVHPGGLWIDGIDSPGTTGGQAANRGSSLHAAFGAIDHDYDAITRITVEAGEESQQNNFSEVIADDVPPILPPPSKDPEVIVIKEPLPFPFQGIFPPPLAPLAPPPASPLIFAGGDLSAPGNSWHLSIIDAGHPRGDGATGDALVYNVAAKTLDAFHAQREHMDQGQFTLQNSEASGPITTLFGTPDSLPVAGDFNGDGISEIGVFVKGDWYLDLNGNGVWDDGDLWCSLGDQDDRPVTGDWDGDGKTDIGIYGPEWPNDPRAAASEPGLPDRENELLGYKKNLPPRPHEASYGRRTMKRTSTGPVRSDLIDHVFYYGTPDDVPLAGDWNGDGVASIGVYNNGTWILDNNGDGRWTPGETMVHLGESGDIPVVGDFNGDGIDDIGVFRDGQWLIDTSGDYVVDHRDQAFAEYGGPDDVPVVGDWNGDGTDEPGLFRPGGVLKPSP